MLKPETLRAAIELARLGLRIFPAHSVIPIRLLCDCRKGAGCTTPGKHPRINNWTQLATFDPIQIERWGKQFGDYNPAVATGQGVLGIDVDDHGDGRNGAEMFAKLEAEFGQLPRDWEVRSGSGSAHLYFSVPPDSQIRDPNRWHDEGVEIKHEGAYLIAPPSLHVSGERYEWVRRIGDHPPQLPARWLQLLSVVESSDPPVPKTAGLHSWFERPVIQNVEEPESERDGECTHKTHNNHLDVLLCDLCVQSTHSLIQELISSTLPRRVGTRNKLLTELARGLYKIPELKSLDAEQIHPLIQYWLELAQPFIGERDEEDTFAEFDYMWAYWLRDDIDVHPVHKALAYMKTKPVPALPPGKYRSDTARRLVMLCAAMAAVAANVDGVWWLSCRDAARILGLDPEKKAKFISQGFGEMVKDRIIEVVERPPGRKATVYRWLGYKPATEPKAA